MKKMTENEKNMLKELIKQLHTGASQQKIKERFIPLGHSALGCLEIRWFDVGCLVSLC